MLCVWFLFFEKALTIRLGCARLLQELREPKRLKDEQEIAFQNQIIPHIENHFQYRSKSK